MPQHGRVHHNKCKHYLRRHHKHGRCARRNRKPKPAPEPVTEEPNPVLGGVEPIVPVVEGTPAKSEPEEVSEATEMKIQKFIDITTEPPTESVWGCAKLRLPEKRYGYIRFVAIYGSFKSAVYGGSKGPAAAPVYCSEYINPPCAECVPDKIDTAWVVVLNTATHTFVESEHVRFNFENPEEDVSNVHPGAG